MNVIIVIVALLLHLAMSVFMGTWIACSGVWKNKDFPLDENDSWFTGTLWFFLPLSFVAILLMLIAAKIHNIAARLAKRRR